MYRDRMKVVFRRFWCLWLSNQKFPWRFVCEVFVSLFFVYEILGLEVNGFFFFFLVFFGKFFDFFFYSFECSLANSLVEICRGAIGLMNYVLRPMPSRKWHSWLWVSLLFWLCCRIMSLLKNFDSSSFFFFVFFECLLIALLCLDSEFCRFCGF